MKTYEKIYNAAIALDKTTLEQIQAENLTLDVRNGSSTVIQQLASENKQAAVTLLLSLGGSRNGALSGYARAGIKELVNDLIKQGASKNDAVRGAARGGHKALEAHIRAQIPSLSTQIATLFGLQRAPAPKVEIEMRTQIKLKLKQE